MRACVKIMHTVGTTVLRCVELCARRLEQALRRRPSKLGTIIVDNIDNILVFSFVRTEIGITRFRGARNLLRRLGNVQEYSSVPQAVPGASSSEKMGGGSTWRLQLTRCCRLV